MPDLNQLLTRAAELAPEWCEDVSPANHAQSRYGIKNMGVVVEPSFDETAEMDRALLLYAVLKECERRGLSLSVEYYHGKWHVKIDRWNIAEDQSDPAVAILSAFVALLESEQVKA